jgi:hypothetical protein
MASFIDLSTPPCNPIGSHSTSSPDRTQVHQVISSTLQTGIEFVSEEPQHFYTLRSLSARDFN